MEYLQKYSFNHCNEYDDLVQLQFAQYLNQKYPPKTNHYYDDYFEDMEKERQGWYWKNIILKIDALLRSRNTILRIWI